MPARPAALPRNFFLSRTQKNVDRQSSRWGREGDGSLDLDEEKRSRHIRSLRVEFENPPFAEAYVRILALPAALPWNLLLSRTLRSSDLLPKTPPQPL